MKVKIILKIEREEKMRSVETPIKSIRRKVFTEICKVAFESSSENFNSEIEAIPYHIVQERASYRESI